MFQGFLPCCLTFHRNILVWYTNDVCFVWGALHSHLEQCFGARIRFPHGAHDKNLPQGRFFACAQTEQCFAIAKLRVGIASEFFDEKIRLVMHKYFL